MGVERCVFVVASAVAARVAVLVVGLGRRVFVMHISIRNLVNAFHEVRVLDVGPYERATRSHIVRVVLASLARVLEVPLNSRAYSIRQQLLNGFDGPALECLVRSGDDWANICAFGLDA